jgi:hypothetical protein
VIETLQLVPAASVRSEQPSLTTVKSSVFGTAALLMNSDAVPVLVTVTCWGGLVVPVSREAHVNEARDSTTRVRTSTAEARSSSGCSPPARRTSTSSRHSP